MRVAVCDDDASIREHYTEWIKLVAEKEDVSIAVDRFEKGSQLLFSMLDKKMEYDIIFLDVFMPGQCGIDLGEELRKAEFAGFIIFLTRSDAHMLPAFDVGAANYIIKGEEYDNDRFEKVLLKTFKKVEKRRRKYILLNSVDEHRNIPIESIQYFEVSKHICFAYYGKGEVFEFSSSLGKLSSMLTAYNFERAHKSFLVNCAMVKSYNAKELVMKNGDVVPLGRKYSPIVRQKMVDLAEIDASTKSPSVVE